MSHDTRRSNRWRAAALCGTALMLGFAVSAPASAGKTAKFKTLWKAPVDECFDGIGNPYPPLVGGVCQAGQPKRNAGYVFSLTTTEDSVWYGTVANTACQVVGGALQAGGIAGLPAFATDKLVCEFAQSQEVVADPTLDGAGDWRPPQIFQYHIKTHQVTERTPTSDPLAEEAGGVRGAGTVGDLVLLGATVKGPEAAGTNAPGVILFAFHRDGTYLGSRLFEQWGNVRDFITIDGILYGGFAVRATGGGEIVRFTGELATPFDYEVVGRLAREQPASFAHHEGRLFATTWGNRNFFVAGGLVMSPVIPAGGLTAADAAGWQKVWAFNEYEPSIINVLATTIGDLESYQGDLYWGSMQPPFVGALGHVLLIQDPDLADILTALLAADRRFSVFRGRNFGTPEESVELLYGEQKLPVFDFATQQWTLQPNNMGGVRPRFGPSGLGNLQNRYLWSLESAGGRLFLGTFDSKLLENELWSAASTLLEGLGIDLELPPILVELLGLVLDNPVTTGADLWRFPSRNLPALPVSVNGLGNTRNYGVRRMEERNGKIYIGTANPFNLDRKGGPELIEMRVR